MTRKHYNAIAKVLRQELDNGAIATRETMLLYVSICTNLAVTMKADNPNFSTDRFLDACGAN